MAHPGAGLRGGLFDEIFPFYLIIDTKYKWLDLISLTESSISVTADYAKLIFDATLDCNCCLSVPSCTIWWAYQHYFGGVGPAQAWRDTYLTGGLTLPGLSHPDKIKTAGIEYEPCYAFYE